MRKVMQHYLNGCRIKAFLVRRLRLSKEKATRIVMQYEAIVNPMIYGRA
jgi:hypothetical protein